MVPLSKPILFAYPHGGALDNAIVSVGRDQGSLSKAEVQCLSQEAFDNKYWISVQVGLNLL